MQVTSRPDDTTIVTIKSAVTVDGKTTYSQVNVIEFWTKPKKLPVIRRIHRLITHADGRRFFEREARLSDFQECPGGLVARRVLLASQSGNDGMVSVREWVSRDLGKTPSADADFNIKIPATTLVEGVANPPLPGQERTLDIRELVAGERGVF